MQHSVLNLLLCKCNMDEKNAYNNVTIVTKYRLTVLVEAIIMFCM